MTNAPTRGWFFTINNPPALEGESPWEDIAKLRAITYATYQLEQGENGTPHFQGCIYFAKRIRFNPVKKLLEDAFGSIPHIEKCKSVYDSIKYCQKEDTRVAGPWSHGDLEQVSLTSAIFLNTPVF